MTTIHRWCASLAGWFQPPQGGQVEELLPHLDVLTVGHTFVGGSL